MLNALIFDVDGTLANTERDGHRVAFNRTFNDADLNWHWSIAHYGELLAVTGGKERMFYHAQKNDPSFAAQSNVDNIIRDLHANKTKHYIDILNQGEIPLRPGVEALLNHARASNLTLAIATTTTPQNVDALLKNTLGEAAISWFDCIGAGDIVANKKPASDIYDYVLEKLALPAGKCIAFEDSENGLISAKQANLTTIITRNEYTLDHDFTQADVVMDELQGWSQTQTNTTNQQQNDQPNLIDSFVTLMAKI